MFRVNKGNNKPDYVLGTKNVLSVIVLAEEGQGTFRVFAAVPSGLAKEKGGGTNVALLEVGAIGGERDSRQQIVRLGLEYRSWAELGVGLGETVALDTLPPPNVKLVSFGVLLPLMNDRADPALHTLVTSDRYTY